MLSNPNMSLMEFAQKVGGITLKPHQMAFIRALERGVHIGYCSYSRYRNRALEQPRYRTTAAGQLKDTETGFVDEPFSYRREDEHV